MNHVRRDNHYAPDLRRWQPGLYMDTGFDRTAHKVDVRAHRRPGAAATTFRTSGSFSGRSAPTASPAPRPRRPRPTAATGQLCYRFSSLGMDIPLFHRAVSQGEQITAAAHAGQRPRSPPPPRLCATTSQTRRRRGLLRDRQEPRPLYRRSAGQPLSRFRSRTSPAPMAPGPTCPRPDSPFGAVDRSRTRAHRAPAARRRISRARADSLLLLRLQRRHGRRRIRAQRRLHRHRRGVDRPVPRSRASQPCSDALNLQ